MDLQQVSASKPFPVIVRRKREAPPFDFDAMPDGGIVRPSQVAELLNVSTATVWRLFANGRLRRYKIGPRTTGARAGELRALIARGAR